ncbi:G patch domain-containing protein 2-like isoform X6 [Penaeus monodon]|uniref:G patch domain-containing protein 2-like isoform X6 n=1 Tax=Penaeus monodon TaxID=6687 RepID=UPI0018A76579|nr:G patch domain-containing protein 2-like isoform X6 [Penaeus monodon]
MASGGGDRLRMVTAVDLRHKMDALVSDLSHALDESQLPQYHRKRRGFKRRAKLANNLSLSSTHALSEDSSSSIGEVLLSQDNKSSIPLTDSDDMSPPPEPRLRTQLLTHHRASSNLVESDSVNENFSPVRPHNRSVNPFLCRKRKCKRLALDPDVPSTSATTPQATGPAPMSKPTAIASAILAGSSTNRKKKVLRPSPDSENRDHSSSESSTESEAGIYTCDEGREADDEQSDWFAEPDPVYGVPGSANPTRQRAVSNRLSWWNENEFSLSSSAKALFKERYEKMSVENQQACRLRFQKLRERLLRREIRAGRRRIRDRKPGFSIVSSVNDKVSRFLQDPTQSELRLRPMTDKDRDQLNHLADLYSLTVRGGDNHSAPILTKTRCVVQHRNRPGNTITKQRLEVDSEVMACEGAFPGGLPIPLSDMKRRRRTPPPPPNNLTEGSNDSVESVFNSAGISGTSFRPPVPTVSWDDDLGDCCADSLSERLADSEPDPLPSPTSLGLHDCTL